MALLWLVLVDIPEQLTIRGYSVGAVLTIATAVVCFLTLIIKSSAQSSQRTDLEPLLVSDTRRVPIALILFGFWATASVVIHDSVAGAQNVLVYDTFVGAVIAGTSFTSAGSADRFLTWAKRAAWLVACLYLLSVARDGLGAESIYGPRSVALAGLVLLAVAVSLRNRLLAIVTLLVIGSSLSRTATVVAMVILCLGIAVNSRRRIPRLGRIAFWSVAALIATGVAVTKIGPLRDRFLGGDAAVQYHGVRYNTSGRSELWSFTWRLAHEHLLLGGGPGDAQNQVTAQFGVQISHPHNDYLRLLNDLGVVGLGLFLLAFLALLRATWIRGKRTGDPIHWAALLALLGVGLSAITDNALVYPFVMAPLGVLVGLSLAHAVPSGVGRGVPSGGKGQVDAISTGRGSPPLQQGPASRLS
jgi:O-antigen ligase